MLVTKAVIGFVSDLLSGLRLTEDEVDAVYQAANGFAGNALRVLPPATATICDNVVREKK